MPAAKRSLSFRIFKHDQLVGEARLDQGVIKIGKVPSAHLRLDDDTVSRMHAIIEVVGDQISVIDLGSTGGTFVNGHRVNKATLRTGDVIGCGASRIEVAFGPQAAEPKIEIDPTLTLPAATPPPPPPPAPPAPRVMAPPALPAPPPPVATPRAELPMPAPHAPHAPQAIEIAAMLGDSVVDVRHCVDPRGGRPTALTWGLGAFGVVALLASAIAFSLAIQLAEANEAGRAKVIAQGKPARAFRPELASPALDLTAFGGLALGLIGVTASLARWRRERRSPVYRIGTAPGVELPLQHAPAPSFPLIAPVGDAFVFNAGAGIDGELIVDGAPTPFADLVAQGRARRSATTAGAIAIPIPAHARIRARAGLASFVVTSVDAPRETTAGGFAIESRTLTYVGGSLAAHLAVLALLYAIPLDSSSVNVDLAADARISASSASTTTEDTVAEREDQPDGDGEDAGDAAPGASMALPEGASGKPDAVRTDGQMTMKDRNLPPALAREQALAEARNSGFLGSAALRGGIASLTGTVDISSGFGDADIYGALIGSAGEGRGNFGFGRRDWGAGGGCMQEPCGTYGTGRYGTLPNGGDGHGRWPGPGDGWGRGRRRTAAVPQPVIGTPTTGGNLDKAIIKRYIKRNVAKIAYCYESQLLARPGIEGDIMVSFLISGSGTVTTSNGKGFDGNVASCVAAVVKNIGFPRPTDGGTVQVNYPFTFHASGR